MASLRTLPVPGTNIAHLPLAFGSERRGAYDMVKRFRILVFAVTLVCSGMFGTVWDGRFRTLIPMRFDHFQEPAVLLPDGHVFIGGSAGHETFDAQEKTSILTGYSGVCHRGDC